MWAFDNIWSYRGHRGLNGNIYKNKTLVEFEGAAHFSKPIFFSTVSVVRGCCFVVICIVLLEDGWVGTVDADSRDGWLYHRRGDTLFQL